MTAEERSLYKLIEKFGPLELTPDAPGVYSVVIEQNHSPLPDRFYLVHADADTISDDAKAYGTPLDGFPDWLYYDQERQDSGKFIITYEIVRRQCLHQPSGMERDVLQLISAFGAKFHPDYFGMFPVPSVTPWGRTVRHRVVGNGG